MNYRPLLAALLFLLCVHNISAQENKPAMRDTLDNRLDVSNYLVNMHGFIPVPAIITEPALGNFGLAIAPVFISPQKDTVNKDRFHFPDITPGIGVYTLNESWLAGAFRMGSFPKLGMRYRAAAGLGSINLNMYRNTENQGELEYEFNFDIKLIMVEASKNIYKNRIFFGSNYLFATSAISAKDQVLPPEYFEKKEFDANNGTWGFFTDVDFRNSMFTADKGIRVKATYSLNKEFTGSDFDYEKGELFALAYLNPFPRLVSAFKAEGMAVTDGAPFYAYPFINQRGIPVMRYQGKQTLLFETEQRYDLNLRWSLIGFVGTGKTYMDSRTGADRDWIWSGGAGFRYLLARVFKLRVGMDVAMGPDDFAYYIVFGHYWNR
jgi:hypothetical protein